VEDEKLGSDRTYASERKKIGFLEALLRRGEKIEMAKKAKTFGLESRAETPEKMMLYAADAIEKSDPSKTFGYRETSVRVDPVKGAHDEFFGEVDSLSPSSSSSKEDHHNTSAKKVAPDVKVLMMKNILVKREIENQNVLKEKKKKEV
jgi:hypothetical protein